MSRPVTQEGSLADWKDGFKCPKCGEQLRLDYPEIVCGKCGYRKTFKEDFTRIIDG